MLQANCMNTVIQKHRNISPEEDDIHCPTWLKGTNLPTLPYAPQPPLDFSKGIDSPTSIYSDLDNSLDTPQNNTQPEQQSRSKLSYDNKKPSDLVLPQSRGCGKLSGPSINRHNIFKYRLKDSIVELLKYLTKNYNEVRGSISRYQEFWESNGYNRLCLENILRVVKAYKHLIIGILKPLTIKSSSDNSSKNLDKIGDDELLDYKIFKLNYDCDFSKVRFAALFDEILFSESFKFNILSYFYKSNFIIDNVKSQRTWLKLPLDMWFALPSFVKNINDNMMKYNGNQELGAILLKLNSFSKQFSIVDELKRRYPIIHWYETIKADEVIRERFFPSHKMPRRGSMYSEYVDCPMLSSQDMELGPVGMGKDRDRKLPKSNSIKGSFSKMMKRSKTLQEEERNIDKSQMIQVNRQKHHSEQIQLSREISHPYSNDQTNKFRINTYPGDTIIGKKGSPKLSFNQTGSNNQSSPSLISNPSMIHTSNSNIPHKLTKQRSQPEIGSRSSKLASNFGEFPNRQESLSLTDKYPQLETVLLIKKNLGKLCTELVHFSNLQLRHCKSWQSLLDSNHHLYFNDYDELKYECKIFYDKLLFLRNFLNTTLMQHISENLILPIDKYLRKCEKGEERPENIDLFTELIAERYHKLYRENLEQIIGFETTREYQKLSKLISLNNTGEITEFYHQLTKLKDLAVV